MPDISQTHRVSTPPLTTENVGILGDGQLAYFLAQAAQKLGRRVYLLLPHPRESLAQSLAAAAPDGASGLNELGALCSYLSIESEEQAIKIGQALDEVHRSKLRPSFEALQILADKGQQKKLLQKLKIPMPRYQEFKGTESDIETWLRAQAADFPAGFALKWTRGGYDGLGVRLCRSKDEVLAALASLISFVRAALAQGASVYAEERIDFEMEMALVATRNAKGQTVFYPLVLTEQERGVCRSVKGPATAWGWNDSFEQKAQEFATLLGKEMQVVGTFALEFFAKRDGTFLVNEIAPRVHNSGHFSISACPSSQFDNHWRAILGLEWGGTQVDSCFAMINILGPASFRGLGQPPSIRSCPASLFWYEKGEIRPGRKMGHINVVGKPREEIDAALKLLQIELDTWSQELKNQGQNA